MNFTVNLDMDFYLYFFSYKSEKQIYFLSRQEFKFGRGGLILELNQFKRLKTFVKQNFHSLPKWISNILGECKNSSQRQTMLGQREQTL